MGDAKRIRVVPVSRAAADECVRRWHYSRRTYCKSWLHLGVIFDGDLWGAVQLGPGVDSRKILGLVPGTPWHGYLEINRMALSDRLPRNAESRVLGVLWRMLRKHAPHIEWVISFADATQCGDGAIYRAAGMLLTGYRRNTTLWRTASGRVVSDVGLRTSPALRESLGVGKCRASWRAAGLEVLPGYQIRYLKPLADGVLERLAVEPIPYSDLPEDVRMVRGETISAGAVVDGGRCPAAPGVRPDPPAPHGQPVPYTPPLWTGHAMASHLARLPAADATRA